MESFSSSSPSVYGHLKLSLGWAALSSLVHLLFWWLFTEFKATTFTYPVPVPCVQFTKSHLLTLTYPANTWNTHFKSIVIFPWNFDFSIFLQLSFTISKVIFGSSFYIIYNLGLRSEVLLNWIPIVLIKDTRHLLSDKFWSIKKPQVRHLVPGFSPHFHPSLYNNKRTMGFKTS